MSQYKDETEPGNIARLIGTFETRKSVASKNIHIVFAHYSRKSFNGALLDKAVDVLKQQGHKVTVSDLYAMNFKTTIDKDDIVGYEEKGENFDYPTEIEKAALNGRLSPDITDEIEKVDQADLVIFQFPMQWLSFPAIMKGWIDRTFINGIVHGKEVGIFDTASRYKGKKAMLSFTTGGPDTWYTDRGINGDMNVMLWPLHSVLRFVNFDILPPHICYSPGYAPEAGRVAMLRNWGKRLRKVFEEEPQKIIKFHHFSDNFQIPADKVDEHADAPGAAPTVGQHAGRPLVSPEVSGAAKEEVKDEK